MGKPNGDGEMTSVRNIHESLVNSNRLRYLRRQVLEELGLASLKSGTGGGDKFILNMCEWNQ